MSNRHKRAKKCRQGQYCRICLWAVEFYHLKKKPVTIDEMMKDKRLKRYGAHTIQGVLNSHGHLTCVDGKWET